MSFKRFIVASDVHGDQQDPSANSTLFNFMKMWKPHIRIMAGDLWDFRPLRGKASEDEKRESMREDFEAGERWFKQFKPQYFLRGNHDQRLWDLAEHGDGVRADYAGDLIERVETSLGLLDCKMLPYHKREGVLRIGSLKVIHGFSCGVYASRQTALIYGSCLFGHVHTIDEHAIPGLERRVARSIGCLCKLDLEYADRMPTTLRHAHGFAYGVIDEVKGHYHVWQAESVEGVWMLPSDIVEMK